mgnify:CR=1 FL=1
MKRNRFIAAFLSLILIVTTMVSPVSAKENSKNPNSSSGKYSWNQLNEKSHSDKKEESSADKSGTEDEALPEDGTSAGESVIEEEAPVYLDGSLTGSDGSYNVTVTFGEDAGIPEGSAVRVEALGEDDAAYQEAKAQVQPDEEGDSFAALDISILDAEGNEIEPNAAVQVEIELSELPEGVDADTEITVSHIDESTGSAVVEDVADTAGATEGTVEVSEDTAVVNFTVESFSTFTITYTARAADSAAYAGEPSAYAWNDLTAYLVDENGSQISSTSISTNGYNNWKDISNAAPDAPSGYEYKEARANGANGTKISQIRYSSSWGWGQWKYRTGYYGDGSDLDDIYFVYRSTGPVQVTLSFDTNGGTGSVGSISGESGTMVTLPTYSGTRNGYTFLGWAESSTDFPGGTGYRAVYQPGSSYELPTSNKTLYAAWQSDTASAKDAYFYIRLDGAIPYEPGSYVASAYTIGIQMKDAVNVQKWVVDVDTTKEVVGNHVSNDVAAVLSKVPSDELIAQVCERENISYNPDTQYILWYVQKYQGLGTRAIDENGEEFTTNGDGWHIDGVILDRAKVALTYNPNVPAGVTEVPDVPSGYSVDRGTVITVGESGAVGGSMDRANPSIPGYVFQGWNTKSDGTGTTYANGDEIKLYESMTLYAMWSKGGNALSLAKVDGLGRTINGAEFTISDGTTSTPFEAGTYAANDILTDTVYTIEETEAPENYDGLDEAFRFIISSQGGTALDAYFCDADGNRVDAPEGVTLTYTNGRVNIRVTNIGYFYVYHSSVADGDIETIAMTAENLNVDGTFDIVEKTYDNYYYGGYYSKYNKVGTVYEGGAGSWAKTYAYTTAGTAMQPAAGETYYLKEVPAAYLQPYMHVIYDERSLPVANELKQMYLITGVDDFNYKEVGLITNNITLGTKKTTASFKVVDTVDSTNTITLTTSSIWNVKGFLGVWDQSSDLKENYEFSYQPYFITPDGITVSGNTTRTVNTQNNHYYNTFDQTADNLGIYRIDSKE